MNQIPQRGETGQGEDVPFNRWALQALTPSVGG